MKFTKSQLVAVRDKEGCRPDCRKWHLRRYMRYDDQIKRHVVVPVDGHGGTFAWDECVPAEQIWPWIKYLNPHIVVSETQDDNHTRN